MGFIDKNKFVVSNKTFYNNEDIIIIDIVSEILFNNLIESFYLSIDLKMKSYRKFAIHYCKYYKEL